MCPSGHSGYPLSFDEDSNATVLRMLEGRISVLRISARRQCYLPLPSRIVTLAHGAGPRPDIRLQINLNTTTGFVIW